MSGIIANTPQPQSAYNASKAGVILLTKSLAGEWAKRGLRVNSISPGYVATEITNLRTSITEWHQKWLELAPMGRLGEVSEGPAPRLISPRMPAAIHRQQPGHGRRLYELGRDDWEQGHSFLPLEADS